MKIVRVILVVFGDLRTVPENPGNWRSEEEFKPPKPCHDENRPRYLENFSNWRDLVLLRLQWETIKADVKNSQGVKKKKKKKENYKDVFVHSYIVSSILI